MKSVVAIDVSWSSDFAMLFDDYEKAVKYIKEEFEYYSNKQMFERNPVKADYDEEYSYIEWDKEIFVRWKLYRAYDEAIERRCER